MRRDEPVYIVVDPAKALRFGRRWWWAPPLIFYGCLGLGALVGSVGLFALALVLIGLGVVAGPAAGYALHRFSPPARCTTGSPGEWIQKLFARPHDARPPDAVVVRSSSGLAQRRLEIDRITDVEVLDGRVILSLSDGRVELEAGCIHGLQLAREVAEAIGKPLAEDGADATLGEDEVARLLGVEQGGGVESPVHGALPRWLPPLPIGVMVLVSLLFPGGLRSLAAPLWTMACFYSVCFWLASETGPLTLHRLRAEGAGLVQCQGRRRRVFPWHAIHSLEPASRAWRLRTFVGDLVFQRRGTEPVVEAVQRVLAAREQGHALPRLGFVGDAAISPVREGEERAERGISRSEGETR